MGSQRVGHDLSTRCAHNTNDVELLSIYFLSICVYVSFFEKCLFRSFTSEFLPLLRALSRQ